MGENKAAVLRGSALFRDSLSAWLRQNRYDEEAYTLLGPAPCLVMKINYNFRYRLTLRCQADRPLRSTIALFLRQFAKDRRNRGVSAFADVNGYN